MVKPLPRQTPPLKVYVESPEERARAPDDRVTCEPCANRARGTCMVERNRMVLRDILHRCDDYKERP